MGTTTSKYVLSAAHQALQGRWDADAKAAVVMYLELVESACNVVLYGTFCMLLLAHQAWPIHLVHDVYVAIHVCRTRAGQVLRYRRLTANMDKFFVKATPSHSVPDPHIGAHIVVPRCGHAIMPTSFGGYPWMRS